MQFTDNKRNRINEIISYVKLGSIIIACIIVLKNSMGDTDFYYNINNSIRYFFLLFVEAIITIIYYFWLFVLKKKKIAQKNIIFNYIECLIFLILFTTLILNTGKNESNYKIFFIIIIITFTIEIGVNFGYILSGLSSTIVLMIDLLYGSNKSINNHFEDDLIISGIYFITTWLLGYYIKIENEHIKMLESKANIDGLTNLYNHRYFYDELSRSINEYKKTLMPLSLFFIDIDNFKHYNDTFGHLNGDIILKKVSVMLASVLDDNAIISRYGGDEFAVIIKNQNSEKVFAYAELLRKTMENMEFTEHSKSYPSEYKLTLSIGIAFCDENINNDMDLIKCADDALYRAKFLRKNRVEIYSSVLDILKKDIEKENIDLISSIKTLISIINSKDRYTYGHIERVVMYSKLFAEKLKLDEDTKKQLIYGAYLHDLGKINISSEILNKKMPLTEEEWDIIKQHPIDGVNIIKHVEMLSSIAPIIMHHHERFDGTGYPDKLKGKQIPYLARILTIIDSFDAMTFNRQYKPAMSFIEAIFELRRFSGIQFDPDFIEEFIEMIINIKK